MFVKNPYSEEYYNTRYIRKFEVCKGRDCYCFIVLDVEGEEFNEIINFETEEDYIEFVRALLRG